jgi:hypothetical protein
MICDFLQLRQILFSLVETCWTSLSASDGHTLHLNLWVEIYDAWTALASSHIAVRNV